MYIGDQIKQKRKELNMTQEDLAKQLNVSRSTISNWEINRNYPDINSIVSLSTILEIPLDTLLRKESDVVKKIKYDTIKRKQLSKKVKILYVLVIMLVTISLVLIYNSQNNKDISDPESILTTSIENNDICISTSLPFYRSIESYFINENAESLEISLSTKLSLKNNETVQIPLSKEQLKNIKYLKFTDSKGVFKTIAL